MIIAGTTLELTIAAGIDITGASSTVIRFIKPTGTTGTWAATVDDAAEGTISYDITAAELDSAGSWTVWAVITFATGVIWKTAGRQFSVYAEGTVQA